MMQFVFNALLSALGWTIQKYARDEELKRQYVSFVEIMNNKGLASVRMRINARTQIERVEQLWKKEDEAKNKVQPEVKKNDPHSLEPVSQKGKTEN